MLPGGCRRRQGEAGLDAGGARKPGLATMSTERSPRCIEIACAVLLMLTVAGALIPAALAQTGGTVVMGLDQEPPTLDPHASPSAVTYQIIGSVTQNLLYPGPDRKLSPWLPQAGPTPKGGPHRTLQPPPHLPL